MSRGPKGDKQPEDVIGVGPNDRRFEWPPIV
jgi:hypothetical protein